MKEFIEYLVTQIVSKPEAVVVTPIEGEQGDGFMFYKITVDPSDMGFVIGKEGKTINSIRNLAKSKAIKDNVHIKVILDEPNAQGNASEQTDAQN